MSDLKVSSEGVSISVKDIDIQKTVDILDVKFVGKVLAVQSPRCLNLKTGDVSRWSKLKEQS